MQDLTHVLSTGLWLMEPQAFRAMIARATTTPAAVIAATVQAAQARSASPQIVGDAAVIDVMGPISYRPSLFSLFFGGSTIVEMQAQFRSALADPAVRAIVFRVDSPGGEVSMVPEFADEVFAARGQKPMVAVADTMMASAAAWIGAQADTVYTSASGQIGSIGVWTAHEDVSQMLANAGIKVTLIAYGEKKVEGNPFEPLTDDARASLQAQVDAVGKEFDAAMARGRGVSLADVRESFGQGEMFRGRAAIGAGLADKLGTLPQVLAKLTRGRSSAVAFASAVGLDEVPALAEKLDTKRMGADVMPPNDEGEREDGYEMGENGMCHMMPEGKHKAAPVTDALAESDAVALALVQ